VAINKMDMYDWSQERFEMICKKMNTFLVKQVGFKENDIMYIPLSGLVGDNLTKTAVNLEKLTSWYNPSLNVDGVPGVLGGLTLLDSINRFRASERSIDKPLRFCVSDVYKSAQTAAISLAGKMETGSVKVGDKICVMPSNEIGQVKSISNNDEQSSLSAYSGDSVILNVASIDMNNISIGNFVCDCISSPMPVSDRLKAKIVLFNLEMPLIKGSSVVFHYKSMSESAIIKKVISQLDKSSGDVIKERPRFLTKGMSAMVEIKINRPICMELYSNYRELGRFMLRLGDTTIAAGLIMDILVSQ
jgi:elongation factor 1 alpha-like protein